MIILTPKENTDFFVKISLNYYQIITDEYK